MRIMPFDSYSFHRDSYISIPFDRTRSRCPLHGNSLQQVDFVFLNSQDPDICSQQSQTLSFRNVTHDEVPAKNTVYVWLWPTLFMHDQEPLAFGFPARSRVIFALSSSDIFSIPFIAARRFRTGSYTKWPAASCTSTAVGETT